MLKIANVCPIYKKKEVYKCENYRPISLLSNISKIFERIMYNRILDFLDTFDLIYKYQFGFRKHHSTTYALLSMVEAIRYNLDQKIYTCGVFVDLEKAFDTVTHDILVKKIRVLWHKRYRESMVFIIFIKSKTGCISRCY